MMFQDRQDAGRQLAARLMHLKDQRSPPVVLGLPRGGMVVAAEIAQALGGPLDVLVVRKIGAPSQPELAVGAVTDGNEPQYVLNQDLVSALGIEEQYLHAEIQREFQEVRRRQEYYRRGRPAVSVHARTVIVVDDGIATGATVRAGIAALRQMNPARIILAVPVGPPETFAALKPEVDEIVCLSAPAIFVAVGRFYINFEQTDDEEVIALLSKSDSSGSAR